ncbi:hypothetical protein BC567DRAFT_228821 [Phyllosticta citribraziliensis]
MRACVHVSDACTREGARALQPWAPFCLFSAVRGAWLDGGLDGWMAGWLAGWLEAGSCALSRGDYSA